MLTSPAQTAPPSAVTVIPRNETNDASPPSTSQHIVLKMFLAEETMVMRMFIDVQILHERGNELSRLFERVPLICKIERMYAELPKLLSLEKY